MNFGRGAEGGSSLLCAGPARSYGSVLQCLPERPGAGFLRRVHRLRALMPRRGDTRDRVAVFPGVNQRGFGSGDGRPH